MSWPLTLAAEAIQLKPSHGLVIYLKAAALDSGAIFDLWPIWTFQPRDSSFQEQEYTL